MNTPLFERKRIMFLLPHFNPPIFNNYLMLSPTPISHLHPNVFQPSPISKITTIPYSETIEDMARSRCLRLLEWGLEHDHHYTLVKFCALHYRFNECLKRFQTLYSSGIMTISSWLAFISCLKYHVSSTVLCTLLVTIANAIVLLEPLLLNPPQFRTPWISFNLPSFV